MRTDFEELLGQIRLAMDEREELEARRYAQDLHLVIEGYRHCMGRWIAGVNELHILEPRRRKCLIVVTSWADARAWLARLRPQHVSVLEYQTDAFPCPAHPQLSVDELSRDRRARAGRRLKKGTDANAAEDA